MMYVTHEWNRLKRALPIAPFWYMERTLLQFGCDQGHFQTGCDMIVLGKNLWDLLFVPQIVPTMQQLP